MTWWQRDAHGLIKFGGMYLHNQKVQDSTLLSPALSVR
jgi:hypothetical protein